MSAVYVIHKEEDRRTVERVVLPRCCPGFDECCRPRLEERDDSALFEAAVSGAAIHRVGSRSAVTSAGSNGSSNRRWPPGHRVSRSTSGHGEGRRVARTAARDAITVAQAMTDSRA